MLKKLIFFLNLYNYKLRLSLGLKGFDIMPAINNYYRGDFAKLAAEDIAVILPHCLIGDKCPAKFSKTDGILCTKCSLCNCKQIYETAQSAGYQFYISPSVGFTKRLARRKGIKGVIGVCCDYEIERGLHTERLTAKGVKLDGNSVKTQGIRLEKFDCVDNDVNWKKVEDLILNGR